MIEARFFLKHTIFGEKEVTLTEWIRAERVAGFRPKCASTDPGYWTTPATGGFSSGDMSGRIEYTKES